MHNAPLWLRPARQPHGAQRTSTPTATLGIRARAGAANRHHQLALAAHTQAGRLDKESEQLFDTLTECMEDAKQHGYGMP